MENEVGGKSKDEVVFQQWQYRERKQSMPKWMNELNVSVTKAESAGSLGRTEKAGFLKE